MLRVIVLGSSAALPTKEHLPACCAVKCGGTFLFDACEAVQQQLMKYGGGGTIDAIFLTHLHADHILGVPGLVQSMNLAKRTAPLLIVGPAGTKAFFGALFSLPPFSPHFSIELKEAPAKPGKVFEGRLFTVSSFPVKHGTHAVGYTLETLSYRRFDEKKAKAAGIHGPLFTELQEKGVVTLGKKRVKFEAVSYVQKGKRIVISGDTLPCPSVEKAARGADLLIHEATFSKGQEAVAKEKKHTTIEQAAKLAKKAKASRLLLTHFSNRYEDRTLLLAEAREVFPAAVLASEGMELLV